MIPEDLTYSSDHEWVRTGDDTVTIGITDYAQEQLGDIVYVSLPEAGERVEAGAVIGELESTKSVSDLFAPLAGEVVGSNDSLEANPELVNSDPYGEGWLLTVRPAGSPEGLMDAAAYQSLLDE